MRKPTPPPNMIIEPGRDPFATPRGILTGCVWGVALWGLIFAVVGTFVAVKADDVRVLIVFGIGWVLLSCIYGIHCLRVAEKKGRAANPPRNPFQVDGGQHYARFYRGDPGRKRGPNRAPSRDH